MGRRYYLYASSINHDKVSVMKAPRFYSVFYKPLVFIIFALWGSNALAYLVINYDSNDLMWQSEELRIDDDDYASYGDFFIDQTINFKIKIIIPDIESSNPETAPSVFNDVIKSISTSNIFTSPLITKSRFELIPEGPLFSYWSLTFDVIESGPLTNGTASGGSFSTGGFISWNPDGSGVGNGIANFMYYWDNWVYRRQQMEWILNTDVHFANYESQLTIEKVSVAEPIPLGLLLAGMIFIFFARRPIKLKI